jgi:glucose/arabinose dehydrogenase
MSEKEPGTLVVSRGSNSNIDLAAEVLASGHSQIKAFNTNNITDMSIPYDFNTEGRLLGWGLRNSVGVAEEPLHGGIYSVENSADQIDRDGVDIHENNPGEEMNYHGFLNASTVDQGGNYGYPYCFALWNTSIPNLGTMTVGSQFALEQNSTINDTFCAEDRVPPRLTFQAHMAPLDIIFLPNGTEAYVSFHGSW